MTQRLLLLLVGLWQCAFSSLDAQKVGFTLPVLNNVTPGSFLSMPLTVTHFDSIVSAQFVIRWNPEVISFSKVLSYNLPGMDDDNFGLVDTASGILRFAYDAPSVTKGTTVADSTAIFRLRFKVVGQVNDSTSIIFTELPPTTIFEVVKVGHPAYERKDCNLKNGFVAIGFTVGTDDAAAETLEASIIPNPFVTAPTAHFSLKNSENVQMLLTDAAGRVLEDQKMALPAGQHGMEIVSDLLEVKGIYYLTLRTAHGSRVLPLIKL